MDIERQLSNLENDVRALKANYSVAASKLGLYITESQNFTLASNYPNSDQIEFTPTYGLGRTSYTKLRAVVKANGNPVGYQLSVNEPQDGSGKTVIRIQVIRPPFDTSTYTAKIYAVGTSPGTFRML